MILEDWTEDDCGLNNSVFIFISLSVIPQKLKSSSQNKPQQYIPVLSSVIH